MLNAMVDCIRDMVLRSEIKRLDYNLVSMEMAWEYGGETPTQGQLMEYDWVRQRSDELRRRLKWG